ncbi:SipW-dependent-type signal peptide-containing protein [Tannockella kyphosi]|uniref:SipW-dependent-type signal peptide-containing protein n=1 Tax=Tannockella kyphosi TaxID=2899121 RepID=UPI00201310D2|nr:SipW-dependent-type signal peptide-containing protein [Tannockella kyphosi]
MRKYAKPITALCLVVLLTIGATIAYLTDQTDEITNSFTVGENVDIELVETDNDYSLIPGETFTKDPTISVTGDDAYIFVEVIETLPTAALNNDEFSFADYVTYEINGSFLVDPLVEGGSFYAGGYTADAITTNWYWSLVKTSASTVSYYEGEAGDTYTTITYVYALVDGDGYLLSVSSLDQMTNLDELTNTTDLYVAAEFPILLDDEVTINDKLTQAMLNLLLNNNTTEDNTDTHTVDLSFIGYAIQSDNILNTENLEIVFSYIK